MKVFVTGATGFVGSHFASRMSETEHQLICLVRKTSDTEHLETIGADLVYGDIMDKASLEEGMRGCDWVVHLAGVYSFWEPDDTVFADVNVAGTRNVMEAALETGVSKVVHTSTVVVYGRPENGDGNGSRQDAYRIHLNSRYSRSKYQADLVCFDLYAREGLPLVVVYPATVLGAGGGKPSGQYIENIARRRMPFVILGDFINTYVYVEDVAEAILLALEKPSNIGERYPVGNGEITWRELNRMICEIAGVPAPYIPIPDWLLTHIALWTTWYAEILQIIPKPLLDITSKWLRWQARMVKNMPIPFSRYLSETATMYAEWIESRRPLLGLSIGTVGTVKRDLLFDGAKTERELGIRYTDIREALAEEIASYELSRQGKRAEAGF
jgi:dihydroflavonol-4-reductase